MELNNSSFVWWMVCLVLSVVGVCMGQSVELNPCYPDGIFDVIENSTDNVLIYRSSVFSHSYFMNCKWTTNGTTKEIVHCFMLDCASRYTPLFTTSVTSPEEVELRIDTTNNSLFSRSESFSNSTITCKDYDFDTRASCRTDLIFPAQDSSCTVQFRTNTSPWSVLSQCDVTKAYSALQRYSCQLFVDNGGPNKTATGPSIPMVTKPIGNGDYVSGTCEMSADLPPEEGRYNYTVMISPGRLNVTAAFTGTNEIRRPSATMNHTCPKYVTEGSDLDCTCTTSDLGGPPAKVQWSESGSSRLVRSRVPRELAGTTFTCQLMWREQVVQSLTYTISTAPSGVLMQQARSEGIGAGVGIGLVVALVCVLVLVVVLWRRGWKLPCAGDRGASQAVEIGPPPTSSQSQELVGGTPSAGDVEECSGPSGLYEGLQHNQMNVPSAYETLHVNKSAAASSTKASKPEVDDNSASGPDGARGGNTPNTESLRAETESPVYGNV